MGRYVKSTDLNGSKVFVQLPKGTTTEQPSSPYGGMIRFNTSLNKLEYYNGTSWLVLSGSTGGAATITVDPFTIVNQEFSDDSSIIVPDSDYGPLSYTPIANENILVFLGGVYQPPTAYEINSLDSTETFIRMLALVPGDLGSSLVVIHGFDSI